jgi:UDP-N-acetylglucosamine/UDP-N-acetylgalactosamine diphosphorylase
MEKKKPFEKEYPDLFAKLTAYNQAHLVRFWPELTKAQKKELVDDLNDIDFDQVEQFKALVENSETAPHYRPGTLVPLEVIELPKSEQDKKAYNEAFKIGEEALGKGQVGVVLVAGGQGTRLGFDAPKGTFPVGPITGRTLFQYHTEKIMALEKFYSTVIPFYIMTSEANHQQTISFFELHHYFGRKPERFVFFKQGMHPAISAEGRIFLADKYQLSRSPDGHGGLLKAIKKNCVLEDMEDRGLEILFYFQVDNALVNICDPTFIGFHILQHSEMSAKTVYKIQPEEKLGHIGTIDGEIRTIEYTELSRDEMYAKNADGRLKFGQGSIAIHVFNVSFFKRLLQTKGSTLPYHVAHKKIPHVNNAGQLVEPETANGYKIEQFIFDAFPFAEKVLVMETDRKSDFSPIKNATGEDSPQTARRDLTNLWSGWLQELGVTVPKTPHGQVTIRIEISPLFALDKKQLENVLPKDYTTQGDILLE